MAVEHRRLAQLPLQPHGISVGFGPAHPTHRPGVGIAQCIGIAKRNAAVFDEGAELGHRHRVARDPELGCGGTCVVDFNLIDVSTGRLHHALAIRAAGADAKSRIGRNPHEAQIFVSRQIQTLRVEAWIAQLGQHIANLRTLRCRQATIARMHRQGGDQPTADVLQNDLGVVAGVQRSHAQFRELQTRQLRFCPVLRAQRLAFNGESTDILAADERVGGGSAAIQFGHARGQRQHNRPVRGIAAGQTQTLRREMVTGRQMAGCQIFAEGTVRKSELAFAAGGKIGCALAQQQTGAAFDVFHHGRGFVPVAIQQGRQCRLQAALTDIQ